MVVETSTPSYFTSPDHEAPTDAGLAPRVVAPQEPAPLTSSGFELPVPGGRHDLEADDPVDPSEELARLKSDLDGPPEDWVPFQSSWQPSEQTWKPLAETWEQARTAPPDPPPDPSAPHEAPRPARSANPSGGRPAREGPAGPVVVTQAAPPEPPPVAQPIYRPPVAPPGFSSPAAQAPTTAPVPAEPAPPPARSSLLLPLVAFNVVFDLFLTPCGPPGRWLKGKSGRNFLGALGVLCLLGAAALAVADGLGWIW
jgi:hypothetical protein